MARNVNFEKLAVQRVQVWGAIVEYEPSVYGGDGTEPRKNIVLAITEEEQAFFQLLEQVVDSKKLTSCIKEGTVKAKVTLDAVNIYDFEKNLVKPPTQWKGQCVNAVIQMRGMWSSKTQSGLSLELTDIQLVEQAKVQQCPF